MPTWPSLVESSGWSMPGRNGVNYNEGTVDFITSQADAVLQYLSPSQVGIGLPASPSAAGGGYVSPTVVNAAPGWLAEIGRRALQPSGTASSSRTLDA